MLYVDAFASPGGAPLEEGFTQPMVELSKLYRLTVVTSVAELEARIASLQKRQAQKSRLLASQYRGQRPPQVPPSGGTCGSGMEEAVERLDSF